jgi:hypothetical protein
MNARLILRLGALAAGVTAAVVFAVPGTHADASTLEVSYTGPAPVLRGDVVLRAVATARGARVVAVTFVLDGAPVGSDTTSPYALDVSTRLLPSGDHRLRVMAVDTHGSRAATKPLSIHIRPGGDRFLTASPSYGLKRALTALARGSVTVRLLPGRYVVGQLTLGSGSRLVGSGTATVLAAPPGAYLAVVVARGRAIRVSDLTIDGGGPGDGEGIGLAVWDGSSDVRIQRLHFVHVRDSGVDVWGRHGDVSVQDSDIDGGGYGFAGVRSYGSDQSHDVSVIRTRVRRVRGFGIVFVQKEYRRPAAALHSLALDDTVSDVYDPAHAACSADPLAPGCGTSEAGIESGGVAAAIIGNRIRRTRWDGIETVGSSTGVSIARNDIAETRVGIYLERSTVGSRVESNDISSVLTGVNIEWFHEGAGSHGNAIVRNEVVGARYASIFDQVGADENRIEQNVLVGGTRPGIVIQGSHNVVRLNRACRATGLVVEQRAGSWEDGRQAQPRANRIADNTSVPVCPTRLRR